MRKFDLPWRGISAAARATIRSYALLRPRQKNLGKN